MIARLRFPAAVLGLALVASPLAAQTPIDESLTKRDARRLDNMEKVVRELRSIVFRARDSKAPVVVQPADTDARLQELANRLSDIEHTLTRLNGAIETSGHELNQAKRENAALQAQLKALADRLAALEQKQTAAEAAAAPAPAPVANPAEGFTQARQLMLNGDYEAAEAAFRDYVQAYPDAPKTPEAHYWWGKTLSVKGDHAKAATAYIGAIRGWPQAGWAADAVVELARALVALKKPVDACQALAELPKHYPKPATAVAARAAAVRAQAKCG